MICHHDQHSLEQAGETYEGTKDVEEQDSDVNSLDRLGQVLAGVLGLSGGDGDNLSSCRRVSGELRA